MSDDNIILQLGSLKIYIAQLVSIALIIFLTYINTKGIKGGKIIQTTFTIAKLLALFGLIIFGFLIGTKPEVWHANWSNAWNMKGISADGAITTYLPLAMVGAIAASMSGSIFSSDAWNNVTFVAGEIKNPRKNIGLSLFFGTLIVTIIYVLTNIMYTAVLPLNDIAFAKQDRVAVAAANGIFGDMGTYVIAALIMVSTFGCNNGLILAGARVYYTMANDGLFFRKAGTLNKYAVPEYALWLQAVVASILCLSGKYGDLLDMIAFVVVIFYALTIIGIFILRKKRPDIERPYRAFGYPVLPIIYIILAIVFCVFLIKMKPLYAGIGLGIVLLGIPLYYIAVGTQKK
jgi:APA family basic amino acid/polyamine antiporter